MKTYRIPNGAERNAGIDGMVLGIETTFGDKTYISGFPADARLKVYRRTASGHGDFVNVKIGDLYAMLNDRANGGL